MHFQCYLQYPYALPIQLHSAELQRAQQAHGQAQQLLQEGWHHHLTRCRYGQVTEHSPTWLRLPLLEAKRAASLDTAVWSFLSCSYLVRACLCWASRSAIVPCRHWNSTSLHQQAVDWGRTVHHTLLALKPSFIASASRELKQDLTELPALYRASAPVQCTRFTASGQGIA